MPVKSNIALSYLAMLSIAGFLLWLIRGFVRGLRSGPDADTVVLTDDRQSHSIDWPVHIFQGRDDDIPVPGRLQAISEIGAFMQSSACLKTGDLVSLYVDVPGTEQVRLTARVTWSRTGRDGHNAAQLVFPEAGERAALFEQLEPCA